MIQPIYVETKQQLDTSNITEQNSTKMNKSNKNKIITIFTIILSLPILYILMRNTMHQQKSQSTHRLLQKKNLHIKTKQLQKVCAKNHTIIYIWIGSSARPIPPPYKQLLDMCKNNVKLLTQKDEVKYIQMWNDIQGKDHFIKINSKTSVSKRSTLLRKVYLYFEGGVYADFDTVINQTCFENVRTDKIIFTNYWKIQKGLKIAQQNFMMVTQKYNKYLKRMIIDQINQNTKTGYRWDQCLQKQCLMLQCQKHVYDRTIWQ